MKAHMMGWLTAFTATAATGLAASGWSAPATAQDDAIVVRSAGLDRLFPSDKDRAFREALRLLAARMEDLPEEIGDPSMPGPLFRVVMEMLMSPITVSIGIDPEIDPRFEPPFTAQFLIDSGDAANAQRRAAKVLESIEWLVGRDIPDAPGLEGMKLIDMGGRDLAFGSMDVDQRPMVVALFNRERPAGVSLGATGLPAGVESVFAFRFNSEPLQPMFEMLAEQGGPQAAMIQSQLEMYGLTGENPMRLSGAVGHGGGYMHGVLRYGNYLARPMNRAMISDKRLTEIDIAMIPADALWAQVSRFDLAAFPAMLESMIEQMAAAQGGGVPEEADIMAMIEEQIGINPERDFFAHLGTRLGMYMADSTGGGGLNSLVAFVEVTNMDAMRDTFNTLGEMLNAMGNDMARGYVRMDRAALPGGGEAMILRFPGLPVPFELSLLLERGHLWMGMSPTSLVAALAHARNPGRGLLENARFRDLSASVPQNAVAFTFMDSPRLAGRGYGIASMGLAALSNAARSPRDPERGAGLMMPGYQELLQNAKASLTVTRIENNDMVVVSKSDPSMTVNLCAVVGAIGNSPMVVGVVGLGAGVMMPALQRARESAQATKSMTQLRHHAIALATFASEHGGRYPQSIDELIEGDYLTADILRSPFGPVNDHHGDFWLDLRGQRASAIEPDRIIGYDRAMYLHSHQVAVLMGDGHIELMQTWWFDNLIEDDEQYEDVDFRLPSWW